MPVYVCVLGGGFVFILTFSMVYMATEMYERWLAVHQVIFYDFMAPINHAPSLAFRSIFYVSIKILSY